MDRLEARLDTRDSLENLEEVTENSDPIIEPTKRSLIDRGIPIAVAAAILAQALQPATTAEAQEGRRGAEAPWSDVLNSVKNNVMRGSDGGIYFIALDPQAKTFWGETPRREDLKGKCLIYPQNVKKAEGLRSWEFISGTSRFKDKLLTPEEIQTAAQRGTLAMPPRNYQAPTVSHRYTERQIVPTFYANGENPGRYGVLQKQIKTGYADTTGIWYVRPMYQSDAQTYPDIAKEVGNMKAFHDSERALDQYIENKLSTMEQSAFDTLLQRAIKSQAYSWQLKNVENRLASGKITTEQAKRERVEFVRHTVFKDPKIRAEFPDFFSDTEGQNLLSKFHEQVEYEAWDWADSLSYLDMFPKRALNGLTPSLLQEIRVQYAKAGVVARHVTWEQAQREGTCKGVD